MAVHPTEVTWTVARARGGLRQLRADLTALQPTRIVLEATGGYERTVVAALAGLPVVVVNPRQTRDFARGSARHPGQVGPDRRRVLARFGHRPAASPPPALEGGAGPGAAPQPAAAPVGQGARDRAAAAPPPDARATTRRRVPGGGDAPDPRAGPGCWPTALQADPHLQARGAGCRASPASAPWPRPPCWPSARTRHLLPPAGCCPRRRGPLQPRQRRLARPPPRLG